VTLSQTLVTKEVSAAMTMHRQRLPFFFGEFFTKKKKKKTNMTSRPLDFDQMAAPDPEIMVSSGMQVKLDFEDIALLLLSLSSPASLAHS
jgi:hypothetical protein